ncbi:ArsR/SmtB family transcription factor [Hippea maritima]|uniref:Regulatory protein ArsR n=1 Tax=Hippea maritima (strain ATCC 700847 / DSM 10411 / MH2) TaxID=760142 RepID=F2LUR5_HIPMA|nr:metalloregulator ArsR/SmtB family transcription factor [Hippea maritima]AEA33520.1 regulatory protein ArsR [Hippea maritima DSM 10411]
MKNFEAYEFKSQLVKALAHPLRLAICEYLLEVKQPKCVNHIAGKFNKNQSVISKHLSILQQVGIVKLEKEGVFTRYTLTNPKTIQMLITTINELARQNAKANSKLAESL